MQIQFYHLLTTTLDTALPKLIGKAYEANYRIGIKTSGKDQNKQLSEALWVQDPESFLPHSDNENNYASSQPILLSDNLESWPNTPNLLVITDGSELSESPPSFDRLLDIFDGSNEEQVLLARKRWKKYKEDGHELSYIRQQPDGSWKKEA